MRKGSGWGRGQNPTSCLTASPSLCVFVRLQSESLACEAFREQLNALVSKAGEAEEVLKESDPVSSAELFLIQTRMDKLKVINISKICNCLHIHKTSVGE